MRAPLAIAVASLGAAWFAGAEGLPFASLIAGAATATAFIFEAWRANARPATAPETAARNGLRVGAVFLWGAAFLAAGYGPTPLYWQHWWQYAAAMTLLGGVAVSYAHAVPTPASRWAGPTWLARMARLTLAQGIAGAIGLGFLIASGKLSAGKPDWLANHVFLAGGTAVVVMSAIAVRALWAAMAREATTPPRGA